MRAPDVLVIGSGVSGQTVAGELAGAGLEVLVAERRETGGTCALRGCEPKKTLFLAAQAVERMRRQEGTGPEGPVRLDWAALQRFKRTFTDPAPARVEAWLEGTGASIVRGEARFVAPDAVEVAGEILRPPHVVIATGARPAALGMPGEEHLTTSETFLSLGELPPRVVFLGGGYISFEFAHLVAAAGSAATIVHRGETVLDGFERRLAAMLARSYDERGIRVLTGAAATAIERREAALTVVLADGREVMADMVVHGAGRVPDLEALGLGLGRVAADHLGVLVGEDLRSVSNPRVHAVGDAAGLGAPLTPVGIAQGRVAARDILEPGSARFAPPAVPSVVFSDPPLAMVGMTEDEARRQGLEVEVRFEDMSGWESSRRAGTPVAGAVTVLAATDGRVLGAHVLSDAAPELVNVFGAAIMGGLTADGLREAVWAYPTAGSEIVYLL